MEAIELIREMQEQIDEDNRYLGDLHMMLCYMDENHKCIKHNTCDYGYVMKRIRELIAENKKLKEQLAQISQADDETTDPQ